MLQQLRPRSIYDVMAAIACLAALGGGTAYAANEWTGANIQDGTLTGADVRGTNTGATTAAVNGSLTSADISGQPAVAAVGQPFVDGTITTSDVKNDSLTGGDI